jgi:hypothetical protein
MNFSQLQDEICDHLESFIASYWSSGQHPVDHQSNPEHPSREVHALERAAEVHP